MRWPWVSRALHDECMNTLIEEKVALRADFRVVTDDYRALLDKYHGLRESGYSAPLTAPTQESSFGPLTRAALSDMSIGQSGIVKRKMREKATELWLEQRGQAAQDEVVAIAVRRGEGP